MEGLYHLFKESTDIMHIRILHQNRRASPYLDYIQAFLASPSTWHEIGRLIRHVTHMNKSWHTDEWMSHGTHISVVCNK